MNARFPYDTTIPVLVGEGSLQVRFNVYRGHLFRYEYFRKILGGEYKESKEDTIKFPEEDPKIFRFFLYWLNTGRLDGHFHPESLSGTLTEYNPKEACGKKSDSTPTRGVKDQILLYKDAPFDALIELYILADQLGIHTSLKDQIITRLAEVYDLPLRQNDSSSRQVPNLFWMWHDDDDDRAVWASNPVPLLNKVWNSVLNESKLCDLLLELFCDNVLLEDEDDEEYAELDPGFLRAAYTRAQKRFRVQKVSPWSWLHEGVGVCRFHGHEAGFVCQHNKDPRILARLDGSSHDTSPN
ncbi:MAG: hypothetical protein Q9220_001849 [cf. Caloplaca sp. 1 TL-2023]